MQFCRILQHFFTNHVGTGSKSHCLRGTLWITSLTRVMPSNLFCGGIDLGRLVGGGTHTVVAWIALTLPVKYAAKLTAEWCSVEASARSNDKFYIFALWLRRFFIPFRGHEDNLFQTFTWHRGFFNVYFLARTFISDTRVFRAENWSSAPIYSSG